MKLKGKVAIITGGGRGLGRSMALAMAKEGAYVVVMSRTGEEIQEVISRITDSGGQGLAVQGDVSEEASISKMIKETTKHYSTVDILVNNAAVMGPARFLEDSDSKSWQETMSINLHGVFLRSRAVVDIMVKQKRGKIINITSGLGQMPFPRFCAYAVSKAAVIQLTRSLADELKGNNIQVNAIDPGVMDTDMQRQVRALWASILGKEIHRQFREFKEKGLLRDSDRVAQLAVFLASADSDHLSGYIDTLNDYTGLGWRP